MPSTYTLNNGIELIATGEQSGTWGATTNINLGLIDTALDGQVTITLAATGTSGSPNTLPISDGSASNGRNRLVIFNDGGDLGGTAYVQLTPNDAEKIVYVRNDLSGSRSILLFQGTYNASNDYEVPAGTTAVVFFNGGGAGAVAANVFNNAHFDALNVVGNFRVNTNTFFVNTSTNRVGIGTASPTHELDIQVDGGAGVVDARILNTGTDVADDAILRLAIAGTTAQSSIYFADGDSTSVGRIQYDHTGDDMEFFTSGTQKVTIDSSGNLDVTGTITSDGLTVDASVANVLGGSSVVGATTTLIVGSGTNTSGSVHGIQFRDRYGTTGFPDGQIGAYIQAERSSSSADYDLVLGTTTDSLADAVQRLRIAGNGDISFYEDTGTTPKFFWDASAEALGIGTTSPSQNLHVEASKSSDDLVYFNNTSASSSDVLRLNTAGVGSGTIIFDAQSGGTTRFMVQGDGNVGIGTSSPAAQFHVNSGAANLAGLFESTDAGATITLIDNSTTGGSAAEHGLNTVGDQLEIRAVDNLAFETDGSERMTIDSGGTVDVGGTVRAAELIADGAGSTDGFTAFSQGTESELTLGSFIAGANLKVSYNRSTGLTTVGAGTRGSEVTRLTINNGGDISFYEDTGATAGFFWDASTERLGLGTSSPSYKLDVQDAGGGASVSGRIYNSGTTASDDAYLRVQVAGTTADSAIFFGDGADADAGAIRYDHSNNRMVFRTAGADEMYLTSAGSLGIGTASPSQALDVVGSIEVSGGIYLGGTTTQNLLDDYEEGTWTPQIADASSGGNVGSATITEAAYRKIGNVVTICAELANINTTGMTAGNVLYIRNIPFVSGATTFSVNAIKTDSVTFQGGRTYVYAQLQDGLSILNFQASGSGIAETNVDVGDITSGVSDISFSITYFT